MTKPEHYTPAGEYAQADDDSPPQVKVVVHFMINQIPDSWVSRGFFLSRHVSLD
jgi:hypothetical protein